jgi:ribosomal protein L34E
LGPDSAHGCAASCCSESTGAPAGEAIRSASLKPVKKQEGEKAMSFAKRLERLERETVCPTCGFRLNEGKHGGRPVDLTTLTKEQKQTLYALLRKEQPIVRIGNLPLEVFAQLPWEERARLLQGH